MKPASPRADSDLVRVLEAMRFSLEVPPAKPGTNLERREVILWLKGRVEF